MPGFARMLSSGNPPTLKVMVKRVVLWLLGSSVILVGLVMGGVSVIWFTADVDTTDAVAFDLSMQTGTSDLGHGATPTSGINGSYLGPTVRAARGENIRIDVENALEEPSTLHWHGMHLPASMDGGLHQMIEPAATWSPTWTIDQPAATLWYHPHLHGSTADHVYRGLAGMFIVDDGPRLPDTYGVDDIPVILQDKKFRGNELDFSTAIFADTGILGDEILVNGTPGPYLDVNTERVRLRLLNASNARIYDFAFSTGLEFDQIATDGGLLPAPIRTDHLRLTPG